MTLPAIWHSLADVPRGLGGTAVTIGNFDGVHLGHQGVLTQLARHAEVRGLEPVALTFHPHPRHVMTSDGTPRASNEPELITDLDERDRLLLLTGVRGVLDLEFTLEFARATPEEFVRDWLVEGLGMRCIVLGSDTRFGRGNAGDIHTMRELAARYDFTVIEVEDLGADGAGGRASSSAIREALLTGQVPQATRMLGRFHTVSDIVHHGHKRGRALGFPTANLGPAPAGLVPADGVYAAYLSILEQHPSNVGGPLLTGARATVSIGTNPTFAEPGRPAPRMVEAYVDDERDLALYGDRVRLEFVDFQRPTVRFASIDELIAQMQQDRAVTRRTLADEAGREDEID